MHPTDPAPNLLPSWPRRVRSFLAIYVACAVLFQLGGATPDWGPRSLMEAFCAGLFGMLAWLAITLATARAGWHRAFWVTSAAALAILGLDEFFELHESVAAASHHSGEHLKVALWVGGGAALVLVHRLEQPSRGALLTMVLGYGMHTLYLLVEVGDGDYFQLPLGSEAMRSVLEDTFELMMLSFYLFAFDAIGEEAGARAATRGLPERSRPSRAA